MVSGDEMPAAGAAGLEGRPPASRVSPIQSRIDAAPPGATVSIGPGTYVGDLILDKPIVLAGRGRPRLLGSGAGSVVRVRGKDVRIEGFDIDGRGGGDLMQDTSGVHVAAPGAVVRDCRITGTLFGVYLREAPGSRVESCTIRGIPGKDPGEKGSGIHVWNTDGFALSGNTITAVRDGFYIQSSPHGVIRGNVARDLRYGVHYMFSDDNLFEDNLFANGAAGAALMYSKRIVFRRNRFLHNRGFASVGLLLKSCDEVLAESNLLADNARGVFLEGSTGDRVPRKRHRGVRLRHRPVRLLRQRRLRGKLLRRKPDALDAGRPPHGHAIRRQLLVGQRRAGPGRRRPHGPALPLSSVFDHLRGNLTAADLFTQGFAAAALGMAERAFPVLDPLPVEDHSPLARPPALPAVPRPERRTGRPDVAGVAGSAFAFAGGLATLFRGRR